MSNDNTDCTADGAGVFDTIEIENSKYEDVTVNSTTTNLFTKPIEIGTVYDINKPKKYYETTCHFIPIRNVNKKVIEFVRNQFKSETNTNKKLLCVTCAHKKLDYVSDMLKKCPPPKNENNTFHDIVYYGGLESCDYLVLQNSDLTSDVLHTVYSFAVGYCFENIVFDAVDNYLTVESIIKHAKSVNKLINSITMCTDPRLDRIKIQDIMISSATSLRKKRTKRTKNQKNKCIVC